VWVVIVVGAACVSALAALGAAVIAARAQRSRVERLEAELSHAQADLLRHARALSTHERVLIEKGVVERSELESEPPVGGDDTRTAGLH
jgi:NAD(P)-dependent dehydrogenase (short-subunit alcohol dehydrogenase family)